MIVVIKCRRSFLLVNLRNMTPQIFQRLTNSFTQKTLVKKTDIDLLIVNLPRVKLEHVPPHKFLAALPALIPMLQSDARKEMFFEVILALKLPMALDTSVTIQMFFRCRMLFGNVTFQVVLAGKSPFAHVAWIVSFVGKCHQE